MSDLYTEALKDIKKLHEVAEQDAKNAIIEAITPYIRKMISEASNPTDFFFEQDEEPAEDEQLTTDPALTAPVAPTGTQGAAPTQPAVQPTQAPGDVQSSAPVSPESGEIVGATMPDEEGKVTVDFEDLFIDDGSITLSQDQASKLTPINPAGENLAGSNPAAAPAPVAPVAPAANAAAQPVAPETAEESPEENDETLDLPTESISYKDYAAVYGNIAEKIDRAFFTGKITDIARESLKQRLFDLLETVDLFREKGLLDNKQARLQENKLEFLFLKLKEAGLRNSYSMNIQNKDNDMKSLKEFAAKLFEEEQSLAHDSASTGKTGVAVDKEASKHAAKVSGVDPKLGTRKDIKAGSGKDSGGTPSWEDGEPEVDLEDVTMNENSPDADPDAHEDVAEGAAGFGDSDEHLVYEVDSNEIAEAVRKIRKESVKRKMQKLMEASDGKESDSWEDGEPEGGEDESHDNLKESLDSVDLAEMLDEDDDMGGDVSDLVLNIDLPPEVEEELARLGLEDDDIDVGVELNVGMGDDDMGSDFGDDDEEVEIEDDELDVDDAGSSEEDVVLVDDTDLKSEAVRHAKRKQKLLEKKLANLAKLLEQKESELNSLKSQLVETNLFTAKAVYYSKFLQRALTEKSISKKALQQIVEHLDKGKTVAETKAIFNKIERKLNEHITASRKLDGSSSKVTKPGSANLNEGAVPQAGRNPNGQTSDRWKELAGIGRKKD